MAMPGAPIATPSPDWLSLVDKIRVRTKQYRNTHKAMTGAQRLSRSLREPVGYKFWGPVGVGKSIIAEDYRDEYPPFRGGDGWLKVLVILVEVPPHPTKRAFIAAIVKAIARAVGFEIPPSELTMRIKRGYSSGTAADLEERLEIFLERCDVQLIIFDEFQHLVEKAKKNVAGEVADWLKYFHYRNKISVVCFGLPTADEVFQAEPQLAERFGNAILLAPLPWGNAELCKTTAGYLKRIDEQQPFPYFGLSSPDKAFRFWCATRGNQRRIGKIIRGAVENGVDAYRKTGRCHLLLEDFATAYDKWIQTYEDDDRGKGLPAQNPFR